MQQIINSQSRTSLSSFPKQYLYYIHQVYVLVQRHMEKKLNTTGVLSFSQFWVLVCFIDCADETKQTASEVAKKMYISEATLSGHVNRLLKQKLILRRVDPRNRRKSIINLTDKGKKVFLKTKTIIESELDKIFAVVDTSDRHKVLNAFDKILDKIIKIK